ncbi:MAG: alpha/beta hydrolase [Clostridia bacterium]|nr:alpha/beta hydrolase [Clostridia bacterium]
MTHTASGRRKAIKKRLLPAILLLAAIALAGAVWLYAAGGYPADTEALRALESGPTVRVERTGWGWFFDGPSESDALVFYPGARVAAEAYAPLLHRLADGGVDVCLVRMPLELAIFGADRAGEVMEQYDRARWYVGGHSLGGAMAARYASAHGEDLTGVILLAAYPTRPLSDPLRLISVYGSRDGVLNRDRLKSGWLYAPADRLEHVIQGGNHAYFGNYGLQKGDGEATISREAQQAEAARVILDALHPTSTSTSMRSTRGSRQPNRP